MRKSTEMEPASMNEQALRRVIFVLIGLIFGATDLLLDKPAVDSLFKAFAVTSLLFIIELAMEISEALRREEGEYDDFIGRHRNVTGDLLRHVNSQISRVLKINDDSFRVRHATLSVSSHDTFWKLLVERVAHGSLTVHAVHSCEMKVWLEHKGLLSRQKQFYKNKNGTIIRILCGVTELPDEQTRRAAALMRDSEIEVRYCWRSSPEILLNHDFSWDFALVEQTGDAAIWRASAPGLEIAEAEYAAGGKYDDQNLHELWHEIEVASVPFREDWFVAHRSDDSPVDAA